MTAVIRMPRGVRMQFDGVRRIHVLLGPERALMLDDIGHAILSEVDGVSTMGAITARLADRFQAPVEEIQGDVAEFLGDLRDKRLIDFHNA